MTKKAAKWWMVGLGLVVPLFYVLSPGPVMRMLDLVGRNQVSERFLKIFYFPLEWLYNNVELVEDFYDWWFGVWMPS